MPPPAYVPTTPVRDERPILPDLVLAMGALDPRPAVRLVVGDGRTDGSRRRVREVTGSALGRGRAYVRRADPAR